MRKLAQHCVAWSDAPIGLAAAWSLDLHAATQAVCHMLTPPPHIHTHTHDMPTALLLHRCCGRN